MSDAVDALVATMTASLETSGFVPTPEMRAAIDVNIRILAGHAATVLADVVSAATPQPHD